MSKPLVYVIGSLRNPEIPTIGNKIRASGFEAFDDWHGAGPKADDEWFRYEQERGRPMRDALKGKAAQTIFHFDKRNLDAADAALLVLPAGKSGHLEAGYMIGRGKPVVVCFDKEPERWDVMYNFASDVAFSIDDALASLQCALQRRVRRWIDPCREFDPYESVARQIEQNEATLRETVRESARRAWKNYTDPRKTRDAHEPTPVTKGGTPRASVYYDAG